VVLSSQNVCSIDTSGLFGKEITICGEAALDCDVKDFPGSFWLYNKAAEAG
jgi:hypothetical protein